MKWLPLESDPDLLNAYCNDINGGLNAQFVDVYGFDSDLLAMVPRPVRALMFLFPISIRKDTITEFKGSCWFSKQTISNACGTVAVLHALANTGLAQGNAKVYIETTKFSTPLERGKMLEDAKFIEEAHMQTANHGSTDIDEDTELHFVSFVPIDGRIVEMDGRLDCPIDHGPFDDFFDEASKIIEGIIKKSKNSTFNLMALVGDQ
eukprot:NODE_624_length_5893_cov_0.149465.p2 type:complete len:206 gc:universal NODE_624_length_5893_cov_0.149465:1228-1845(+)